MSLLLDALRKAETARAQLRKNSPLPPVADALPAVAMAPGEIPMRGAAHRNTLQDLTQRFEQAFRNLSRDHTKLLLSQNSFSIASISCDPRAYVWQGKGKLGTLKKE